MSGTTPSPSRTILVVDDDSSITASLALLLRQRGFVALAAGGPEEALERLGAGGVDLVLQDMNFSRATGGDEGLELLGSIRERSSVPVILMTAWGTIDLAVRGMRAGAQDFITKPWGNDALVGILETALEVNAATSPRRAPRAPSRRERRAELDRLFDFDGLVGEDHALLDILEMVSRIAPTDASVLITGESGTGKEELAEAVHRNSRRVDGPFVKVNVGGISSSLFESEMFGHLRGAFTDARSDRQGRFELADGGTIFLDEIGELEAQSQVKLLRVLQDRSFEVLGSSKTRRVDVRVISATNRRLAEMVESGSFREDLLYRLNLITLELPPLRERRGDIPRLARHFLDRAGALYGRPGLELDPSALEWLDDQRWPGNVRQLKQAVERAVLVGRGETLSDADFADPTPPSASRASLPAPGAMTLADMEKAMIEKCMARFRGNISQTARALGLSRAALYRRFERYRIDPEAYGED